MINKRDPEWRYDIQKLNHIFGICGDCHKQFYPMFNNQFFCEPCRRGMLSHVTGTLYDYIKGAIA